MVRAILDGRKTMTRRIVRLPKHPVTGIHYSESGNCEDGRPGWLASNVDSGYFEPAECWNESRISCPFGTAGDRLWVRETWGDADRYSQDHENEVPFVTCYKADFSALSHTDPPTPVPAYDITTWNWSKQKWRPSIHMPRLASRLTLEVTSVRVERLQDITREDAISEGIEANDEDGVTYYGPYGKGHCDPRAALRIIWDEINGERASWDSNPWVWVVSFRRVTNV
jgi:hypothetical protein